MKKRSLGILVFCLLLFGLCGTAFAAEKTKSPYYITVNLTANVVTVYEKDAAGNYTVPIKAFRCSVGTSLFSYFVAMIVSKWYKFTNKGESESYGTDAVGAIDDVMRKIYYRKKPTRVVPE